MAGRICRRVLASSAMILTVALAASPSYGQCGGRRYYRGVNYSVPSRHDYSNSYRLRVAYDSRPYHQRRPPVVVYRRPVRHHRPAYSYATFNRSARYGYSRSYVSRTGGYRRGYASYGSHGRHGYRGVRPHSHGHHR